MVGKKEDASQGAFVEECTVIDPSLFTLPYDLAVCETLAKQGYRPILIGRPPRAGERDSADYLKPYFPDPLASLSYGSRTRKLAKACLYPFGWLAAANLIQSPGSVVNIQWLPFPAADLRALAYLRRRHPILYTAHDTMLGNAAASIDPTKELLQRLNPDAIIVHTRQGFDRLRSSGVAESNLVVVPHPPLTLPTKPQQTRATTTENDIVELAMIGEVKAYKGYDTAFRALAELPEELVPRVRLRVAGRPFFDIEALRDEILPAGRHSMIQFELRYLSEDEFASALDRCSCLLLPYREIEASGVLFVALERARMILASKVGAFGEILTSDFLVPAGGHEALAHKLVDFIKSPATWPARTQQLRDIAQQHLTYSAFEKSLRDAFLTAKQNFHRRST